MFFRGCTPSRPPGRSKHGKTGAFSKTSLWRLSQLRCRQDIARSFLDAECADKNFTEKLCEKNSGENGEGKENHTVEEQFEKVPQICDILAPSAVPLIDCTGSACSKPSEKSAASDEKGSFETPGDFQTVPASVVNCPGKTGSDVRKPLETLKTNNENKTETESPLAGLACPKYKDTKGIIHIVILGTPCVEMRRFHCPFTGCLYANREVRSVKEHMESCHKLSVIRVNLACPCPPSFNDGRECRFVEYDPRGGIVLEHVRKEHPVYFQIVQYMLREEKGTPVYEENVERLDCFLEHDLEKIEKTPRLVRKTFPSWLTATPRLPFPSEGFSSRVVIPTAFNDEKLFYICNTDPCNEVRFESSSDISIHMHMFHKIQPSRADYLYSCPFAPTCTWKMETELLLKMHAKACVFVHGERTCSRITKKIRETLEAAVFQRLLPVQPYSSGGDRHVVLHCCPLQNCRVSFKARYHVVWHISAAHEDVWNPTGSLGVVPLNGSRNRRLSPACVVPLIGDWMASIMAQY